MGHVQTVVLLSKLGHVHRQPLDRVMSFYVLLVTNKGVLLEVTQQALCSTATEQQQLPHLCQVTLAGAPVLLIVISRGSKVRKLVNWAAGSLPTC